MFAKKASGLVTVTYDEALDIALCYGWIDARMRAHDKNYYHQHFVPRRLRNVRSRRNVEAVGEGVFLRC